MDVLQLLDRLEQLINQGTRLPLSSRTMIDEQEFLDIIDQLRVTVPEEIKQARKVSQERERITLQAEAEAEKILNEAQDRATAMLQDNELIRRADEEAQRIVDDAQRAADEIRRGADEYAHDVLAGLETELTRLLATVRRGRAALDRGLQHPGDGNVNPPE